MQVDEIAPGLWRWTAPHPAWTPANDGWSRWVGCIHYDAAPAVPGPIVLIDPLAPPEGTAEAQRFWEALDRDVARASRPLAVLIGNRYHGRSADAVHARYAARLAVSVHVHAAARDLVACRATHTFEDGDLLPGGVQAHAIEGLEAGETALFIPPHRALVFADALLGAGDGRLRLAPRSWAAEDAEAGARYHDRFRASLRRLLDLDPEMLLPSHGEPVLAGGAQALAAALGQV